MTVMVTVLGPAAFGDPEIAPAVLIVKLAGRPVAVKEYEPDPPVALICTGPYENCSLWADEWFAHPDRPDGILYPSRHDPGETCIALFERNDLVVTIARDPVPLRSIMRQVIETLRRYGKGLE